MPSCPIPTLSQLKAADGSARLSEAGKLSILPGMRNGSERKEFLSAAVRACKAAGRIQRSSFGGRQRVEHKGDIDLVTDVDRRSEERILAILGRAFPGHGFLAEESGARPSRSGYQWVIDPLDGTTNYSRGVPFFAVSIALAFRGETLAGAVYQPVLEELFTATRGGGAFLNGRPIRVSDQGRLGGSLLATGFPYDIRRSRRTNLDHFSNFAVRSLGIRRAGAAALDLAYVAAGRFDGFWELKLQPWDMAAGALLVTEAGGRVSTPRGGPFRFGGRDILASNGAIHDAMLAVLKGRTDHPPI